MGPTTPSPFRFLASQEQRQSSTQDAGPSSTTRIGIDASIHVSTDQHDGDTPNQFAAAPRFSFGKSESDHDLPSLPKSNFAQALKATAYPREDVEDSPGPASDQDEEMLDDDQARASPTETHNDGSNDLAHSTKRRRLDALSLKVHEDIATAQGHPTFKHPQTPASRLPKPGARFAPSQYEEGPNNDDPGQSHHLAFLPSSAALSEPSEPLPETFSPHRRGQKFIVGGVAAIAQRWIIETGQSAVQSRRGQAYQHDDGHVHRLVIEDVVGDGPFLATTTSGGGEHRRVLLTKVNDIGRARGKKPAAGSIVGVRAPTWDVELDGQKWTICVDWKLLK